MCERERERERERNVCAKTLDQSFPSAFAKDKPTRCFAYINSITDSKEQLPSVRNASRLPHQPRLSPVNPVKQEFIATCSQPSSRHLAPIDSNKSRIILNFFLSSSKFEVRCYKDTWTSMFADHFGVFPVTVPSLSSTKGAAATAKPHYNNIVIAIFKLTLRQGKQKAV